jgi:Fic family protein
MRIESRYPYIANIDISPVKHVRKVPFNPCAIAPKEFSITARRVRELDLELSRFILKPRDYLSLIEGAYASNAHWSTALEGNPLSLNEVGRITRTSFAGKMQESPDGPTQEILNHLLVLLYPELFRLPWDHQKVMSINQLLLIGTDSHALTGEYRKVESSIREGDSEVFVPAPASHIEEEMGSLLTWVNRSSTAFDPVIGAAIFFHEFESIHPFEDGNGRTGRSLFHIYLQCNGLINSHLCKLDEFLLKDKSLYYQVLMYTDFASQKGGCQYTEIIDYFAERILQSYEATVLDLSKKDLLGGDMDETCRRLMVKSREVGQWFTRVEASTWVKGVGEQTVGSKLSDLVELGVLEATGKTRARQFRFRDPMQELRNLMSGAIELRQEKLDVGRSSVKKPVRSSASK